jgi:hypothetical protein
MLKVRKREECEDLCRERIQLEKTLGVKEIDFERCVRICRAFTTR